MKDFNIILGGKPSKREEKINELIIGQNIIEEVNLINSEKVSWSRNTDVLIVRNMKKQILKKFLDSTVHIPFDFKFPKFILECQQPFYINECEHIEVFNFSSIDYNGIVEKVSTSIELYTSYIDELGDTRDYFEILCDYIKKNNLDFFEGSALFSLSENEPDLAIEFLMKKHEI